jgi:hypothetical protein
MENGEKQIADSVPEAVVLFADVVSFTEMAAQNRPEVVVTTLNLEASVRSACSMEADKAGCRTSLQAGLNETAGRIGAMGIVFREGGQDDRFQVDEGGLRLEPGEGWPRGRREIDGECRGGGSAALHRGLESSRPCVAGQKSLCRHAWRRVAKRSMWTRAE